MDELERIVGAENVQRDALVGDRVRTGTARALVRPAGAEQVAEAVTWCYAHDVPIVPVGGRSGLAGGAAPLDGDSVAIAGARGHAGDGNLHATFLVDPDDLGARERADAAAEEVLALAVALGGSVTGEHGIGVLKRGWLSRQWDPGAVAAQRAVKAALDPKGLFNPGKKQA